MKSTYILSLYNLISSGIYLDILKTDSFRCPTIEPIDLLTVLNYTQFPQTKYLEKQQQHQHQQSLQTNKCNMPYRPYPNYFGIHETYQHMSTYFLNLYSDILLTNLRPINIFNQKALLYFDTLSVPQFYLSGNILFLQKVQSRVNF